MTYKQRLQEMSMLECCKETIEAIAANAYYAGYMNVSPKLTWNQACESVKGCVDTYLDSLRDEAS